MAVNMVLVNKVLDQIKAKPENWDQTTWTSPDFNDYDFSDDDPEFNLCGSRFCFGGWALFLSNRLRAIPWKRDMEIVDEYGNRSLAGYFDVGMRLLGFNEYLATRIFYSGWYESPEEFATFVLESIDKYGELDADGVEDAFLYDTRAANNRVYPDYD